MYNLYIPLCGLVLSIILLILYRLKVNKIIEENKFYYGMIINSVIIVSSCIIAIYLLYTNQNMLNIVKIANKIECYSIFNYFSNLLMYILYISNNRKKKFLTEYIVINIIMFILIFALPVSLKVTSDLTYMVSVGPSVNITMISGFIVLVLTFILSIKNIKRLKEKTIPIILLLIFIVFIAFMRYIKPEFICLEFLATVVLLIMYFTIENPDMKMIEQLELAKEQAEKANHAKTEFLSSMSHEIRTPLNAIVGFSDFIMNADNLDEAKENAKDIINASNTLLEIVNGILDISKIESGKLEIINSRYKAYDTFESLAKLIMPKMQEKGLDFTYYIAKDIPDTLYGDHANIKKVVTNLLSNAAKYTEKGFVRYEVNCVNDKDSTKLIISVEDSGRGIKKGNIDKLFNKFERLDEDRNTTIEGTGLGLAITKQLVELMNGKIVVHTIYGKGSKFTIILNQKITDSIKEEKISSQNIDNTSLKNLKILTVDDNPLNLKVTKKILNRLGINNVDCTESGFACVEKIESGNKYDLILLDDMMPKMNGSETLSKLKKIPGFNSIVIALTANALTGMREKYLNNGFNGYLSKPIDKEALIKELKKTLIESNYIFTDTKESINDKEEVEELVVDEKSNDYDLSYLKKNNIDIDRSIELLGDVETYNETLKDFMSKLQERFEKLQEYIKESDMPDYAISVHGLKSDCKYLGFTTFANIAYEHEIKSKENDLNFVTNHFQELVTEKDKISAIAEQYLSKI